MKRVSDLRKYQLEDEEAPVDFAIRTMSEIDERNHGQPDTPHYHDYYTVIWAKDATGEHMIDFKTYAIEPNTLFFVRPGQVHQLAADPKPEGEVILFREDFLTYNAISPQFIADLNIFRPLDENPPLSVTRELGGELAQITAQMHESFDHKRSLYYHELGSWLKLLLLACHKHCTLPASNTQEAHHSRELIRQFSALLEEEYHHLHQVQEYAERLHLSAGYLNEIIGKYTGMSVKDHIATRIVTEAKRLALFTDLSNKEIAFHLGFHDPSHFAKFFKHVHGSPLSAFRQAYGA